MPLETINTLIYCKFLNTYILYFCRYVAILKICTAMSWLLRRVPLCPNPGVFASMTQLCIETCALMSQLWSVCLYDPTLHIDVCGYATTLVRRMQVNTIFAPQRVLCAYYSISSEWGVRWADAVRLLTFVEFVVFLDCCSHAGTATAVAVAAGTAVLPSIRENTRAWVSHILLPSHTGPYWMILFFARRNWPWIGRNLCRNEPMIKIAILTETCSLRSPKTATRSVSRVLLDSTY